MYFVKASARLCVRGASRSQFGLVAALAALIALAGPGSLARAQSSAKAKAPVEKAQSGPPASLVRVDEVRREPLAQTVPVIGRLVARRAGSVAARIAGPVKQFSVEVGDRVSEGDVIAELYPETMQAELAVARSRVVEAKADLVTARAETALARQELARIEGLRKSVAFPQGRFEDARQKVAVAEAKVSRARAAIAATEASLRLAELNLSYVQIRAPYDGVVIRRMTEAGAYVRAGDAMVQIVGDRSLEVEADVPSLRISGLPPQSRVGIELEDGRRFDAAVRAVLPTENPLTRTRTVRFVPRFDDKMRDLADSQTVTVHVPVGERREVVTVHKDAIIRSLQGSMVFVVEEGKANPRPVRMGEAAGGRIEVLDGLAPGDKVVVRGNERLQPGAPVRIDGGA